MPQETNCNLISLHFYPKIALKEKEKKERDNKLQALHHVPPLSPHKESSDKWPF